MRIATIQKRHVLPAILLLAVLLVAGWHRGALLERHFGHVDDLGVALSITQAQAQPMDSAFLLAQVRDKERLGRGTERTTTLRRMLGNAAVRRTVDALAPLYPFVAVPLVWTYAPLPFLATPLLIAPDQDYATVKWRGRLPSLAFALAAIAMIALTGWRAVGTWGILAAVPLAFSREFTVMSVQMHSYAATVFTAAALLWLTIHDSRRSGTTIRNDWRFVATRGIALAASCYLSYQSILLVPGYLAALAITRWRGASGQSPIARLGTPVLLGGIFALAILPAWFFRLRTIPSVNWNAGPHGEFLFQATTPGQVIATLPAFLAENGWLTATTLLAPVMPETIEGQMLSAIWIVFSVAGLAVAARQFARPISLGIAVYAATTLAIVLLFVVAGKLTLSPTRHLLVLLPVVALLGALGLAALPRLTGRIPAAIVAAGIAVAFAGSATAGLPALIKERNDRFSEARVAALVKATRPDLVLGYDWTVQPMLMPSIRRQVPVALADPVGISRPLDLPAGARVLLLSHRTPLGETMCRSVLERLGRAMAGPCLAGVPMKTLAADVVTAPEVESSPRTKGGGNGFFAALIRLPEPTVRQRRDAEP